MENGTQVLNEFLQAIFPERCPVCGVGCGLPGPCETHRLRRERNVARCLRCAARLPAGIPAGGRCADCVRRSLGLREVLTLGDYHARAGLRDWVLALKHRHRPDLARPLGLALAQCLDATDHAGGAACLLVPVPLHPLRRFERGYNQALLLARAAAGALGAQVLQPITRRRWSAEQGAANSSRAANVAGAFRARRQPRPALDGDCMVWLVDDVLTSGATLAACAKVLRGMGARRVGALVVARASARGESLESSPG